MHAVLHPWALLRMHILTEKNHTYTSNETPDPNCRQTSYVLRLAVRLSGFRLCPTRSPTYRIKAGKKMTSEVRNTHGEPATK